MMNIKSKVASKDNIYIEGLKIRAKIGVYEWEKKVEQTLFVDLVLNVDLMPAGQSDDLADTLNYAVLGEKIQALALAKHYQLLEHFAEVVATAMLELRSVTQVSVKICKPAAIPAAAKVGVELVRWASGIID